MSRYAVLIGASEFPSEPALLPLRCPLRDVRGLAAVLTSEVHGPYEALPLENEPSGKVRQELYRILRSAGHDDLVLIYYSGHGKLDAQGNLYLATKDTVLDFLPTSAVMVDEIRRFTGMSKSSRKIVILDCCFSGAASSADWEFRGDIASQAEQALRRGFESGSGTFVLTASRETQLAVEREGDEYGLLTKHIISGIREGAADRDDDGQVSMQELLSYVQEKVAAEGRQQPEGSAYKVIGGELYIASTGRPPKDRKRVAVLKSFYETLARTSLPARPARLALTMLDTQTVWPEPVLAAAADALHKLYQCNDRPADFLAEILSISQWVERNVPCAGTDAIREVIAERDRFCAELQAQQARVSELEAALEEAGRQASAIDELAAKLRKSEAATAAAKRAEKKAATRLEEQEVRIRELEEEKARGANRTENTAQAPAVEAAAQPPPLPEIPASTPENTEKLLRFRAEQIEAVLRSFANGSANDFYCRPNIPANKLANAARTCLLKPSDVIGLIDCTIFGSAKDCVVFTAAGVHYKNMTFGAGVATYTDLSTLGEINLTGSSCTQETVRAVLAKLAEVVSASEMPIAASPASNPAGPASSAAGSGE